MKFTSLLSFSLFAISPIAIADHHAAEATKEDPAEPAKKADIEVTIECNDSMQFNTKEFEVTAGQTVQLTLHNVGKLPKTAMGHNLVILKADEEVAPFAMAAMQARATEYIPADEAGKAKIVAYTKLLGPDEKDVITFTAPAAGSYNYICTFPGHFGVMKGVMTVK